MEQQGKGRREAQMKRQAGVRAEDGRAAPAGDARSRSGAEQRMMEQEHKAHAAAGQRDPERRLRAQQKAMQGANAINATAGAGKVATLGDPALPHHDHRDGPADLPRLSALHGHTHPLLPPDELPGLRLDLPNPNQADPENRRPPCGSSRASTRSGSATSDPEPHQRRSNAALMGRGRSPPFPVDRRGSSPAPKQPR